MPEFATKHSYSLRVVDVLTLPREMQHMSVRKL